MSSFNIEKFEYIDTQEYPVSLLSYIVSCENDSKYIVFKFNNNLNQELRRIKYEVSCFDKDNCLVEKIVFANTMSKPIKANLEFVCEEKLKVSNLVQTIKVNLVEADFDRSQFRNGKLFKVTQYTNQKDTKSVKKEKVIVNKNKSHNSFKYKSVYKIKRPKLLNFIFILVLLISIAGIVGSLYLYKDKYDNIVKLDGLTYEIKSEKCYVSDVYDNKKKEFSIPKEISYNDAGTKKIYSVSGISEGAFKNSKVTEITLNSNVVIMENAFINSKIKNINNSSYITSIGESAFENCINLTNFSSDGCSFIAENAFKNCTNLNYVTVNNANIADRAFENTALVVLSIGNAYSKIRNLFVDNSEIISLNNLKVYNATTSVDVSYMNINYLYIPSNISIKQSVGNINYYYYI